MRRYSLDCRSQADTQQEGSRGEGKGLGPEAALEIETMGPAVVDYKCGERWEEKPVGWDEPWVLCPGM